MIRRPPRSTRTDTLFPYTTLFRSVEDQVAALRAPLLEDLGQVATIEVRTPERVDDQRLEAVALAAPRLALLGEPSAQVLQRRHLTIVERSEEHTSELQSLMRISYAVFCLKKKKQTTPRHHSNTTRTKP